MIGIIVISEHSKVTGYKIDVQKLIVFLYTSNKLEFEILKCTIYNMTPTNEVIGYKLTKMYRIYCGKLNNSNESNKSQIKKM